MYNNNTAQMTGIESKVVGLYVGMRGHFCQFRRQ